MTMTLTSAPVAVTPARPRLITAPLLRRLVTMLGASLSFYLLLSAVPLYATATSGAGAAGLATGALMVATVAGESLTPRLVARFGYRLALTAGLILLGAPSLALIGHGGLYWITAVCVVRGLGFAIMVVAGGALTAELVPAERRGEGLALVGVVAGVPALAALPAGVWLAGRAGYGLVFAVGAATALAALAAVPGLPGRRSEHGQDNGGDARRGALLAAMANPVLRRPAIVFAATTAAAGVIVTFVPLLLASASGLSTALALFAQAAAATVARVAIGRYADRRGAAHLLVPSLLLAAAGIGLLALPGGAAVVIAGSVVFGAGFGVAQNATLSLMYARATADSYTAVSALWNIAYDAGMGAGAAIFGLLAGQAGYPAAFAMTAVAMLAAVLPARRDR
jgi:predicted MFS family arabinose efflux permease